MEMNGRGLGQDEGVNSWPNPEIMLICWLGTFSVVILFGLQGAVDRSDLWTPGFHPQKAASFNTCSSLSELTTTCIKGRLLRAISPVSM